jgi:hypothetical protein
MDRAPNVLWPLVPVQQFCSQKKGGVAMEDEPYLEGPVLKIEGTLTLIIPLSVGGSDLVECSRGISQVQGEFLKIEIPEWLAGLLRIDEGDLVRVRNDDGKFEILSPNPRPVH